MANGSAATINQAAMSSEEVEDDVELPEEQSAGVSPLDPDFLLVLPLAGLLDLLSYIFMGLDAGVVASVVNIVLGFIIVAWMVWRGKRMDEAKQQYQQAVQTARAGKAGLAERGRATQKMTAKSIGGKRVSRRLLKRSLLMYAGEAIPIVNFIPFWLVGVIWMLREK